jgi:hypothetical protein
MQIPQPPGIEAYLAPGRPDIAGAFTRGMALGQQARERADRKKEFDAERAYRIDRDRAELLGRFGADAVIDPESGVIDPGASAAKREERLRQEQIARGLGEASIFDPKMNIPPGMEENPAFQQGAAAARARMMEGEFKDSQVSKRALDQIQAKARAQENLAKINQIGQAGRDFLRRAAQAAAAGDKGDTLRIETVGPNGEKVIQTLRGDEARQYIAAQPKPRTPAEQERDASIEAHEKAIRYAKRLRDQGENVKVTFDKDGKPVVNTPLFGGDKNAVGVLEASLAELRGEAPAQPPAARGRTDARGRRAPVRLDQLP